MVKSRKPVRTKKAFKAKKTKHAKKKKLSQKKMASADVKRYKKMLIEEREKAGGDLSHIAENTLNKSAREASGDLSGYSYHMADVASDDYERDFSLGRATDEQKRIYAIDEAMKRIDDGIYGKCLQCGKQISKSRLSALPHTETCIDCQKKKEE